MFWGGIVFLFLAIIVLCYRQLSTHKLYDLLISSDKQKIDEYVKQITDMKKEHGEENTTAQRLAATGMAKCDQPLTSPLGNVPCIYYKMSVTARWTESYVENNVTKTKERSEVVASEEKFTSFKIEDNTGFVNVVPTAGSFEAPRKSVDKSEVSNTLNISFGNFQLELENQETWNGGSPETIVYEYKEEVIDVDSKITVVGMLCYKMGDLVIEKHEETPVIVSTKSSDEMIKDTKSTLKAQLIATVIFTLLGVGLIVGNIIGSEPDYDSEWRNKTSDADRLICYETILSNNLKILDEQSANKVIAYTASFISTSSSDLGNVYQGLLVSIEKAEDNIYRNSKGKYKCTNMDTFNYKHEDGHQTYPRLVFMLSMATYNAKLLTEEHGSDFATLAFAIELYKSYYSFIERNGYNHDELIELK